MFPCLNMSDTNKLAASLIQKFEEKYIISFPLLLSILDIFSGVNIFSLIFGIMILVKRNSEYFFLSIFILIFSGINKIVLYSLHAPPITSWGKMENSGKFCLMNSG